MILSPRSSFEDFTNEISKIADNTITDIVNLSNLNCNLSKDAVYQADFAKKQIPYLTEGKPNDFLDYYVLKIERAFSKINIEAGKLLEQDPTPEVKNMLDILRFHTSAGVFILNYFAKIHINLDNNVETEN